MTSRGIITRGMSPFIFSTLSKALGSQWMLNSAAGVMFPFSMAPPIRTICFILLLISEKVMRMRHRLVREPVLTQTMGSSCFMMSE